MGSLFSLVDNPYSLAFRARHAAGIENVYRRTNPDIVLYLFLQRLRNRFRISGLRLSFDVNCQIIEVAVTRNM